MKLARKQPRNIPKSSPGEAKIWIIIIASELRPYYRPYRYYRPYYGYYGWRRPYYRWRY